MQIYLEEVFLINTLMYLSFLIIISYAFHFKLSKIKCVFASFISSIFSLIFSNFSSIFFIYILQLITVLFLITFSFKNFTIKKLMQSLVLFSLISNVFSSFISSKFIQSSAGFLIYSPLPVFAFLMMLIVFTLLLRKSIDIIIKKSNQTTNLCNIELKFNNKKICTTGYLDTGNNLTLNNKPVSIINFKLFNSLTGISLSNFLSENYKLKNQEYMQVSTITGSKKMLTFELEEIKIKNKKHTQTIKKANVAISLHFNNLKDYDVILNNNYIN